MNCPAPPDSARTLTDAQREARSNLLAVMAKAHVWPNLRRKLADDLVAEDGPGWLRQALGWVCYGVRRFPRWDLGAVVYPALRDRLTVEAEYLPSPALDFAAALAWAEAGGQADPDYANARDDPPACARPGDSEQPDGGPPMPPGLHSGHAAEADAPAAVWRRAQQRLQAEMPSAPLQDWLRGALVEALGAGLWRLTVPTPQARDWLSNRLRDRLARSLSEAAGEVVRLEIAATAG